MFYELSQSLHQNDVELILEIQRLRLQPNRFAGLFFKLGETASLLVEQQVNDILVRKHQYLVEFELPRLPDYLAKYFETNRLRGHNETAPITTRTVFAQDVLQAFARAFSRHLDEPEWRNRHDLVPRVISRHRLLQ